MSLATSRYVLPLDSIRYLLFCLYCCTNWTTTRLDVMNWTCVVYGGPMVSIIIWWFVDAKKWFKGPKVNVEHHMFNHNEVKTDSTVNEIETIQD